MASPSDTPTDTVTPLAQQAAQLQEWYQTLLATGWTRADALDLIGASLAAGGRRQEGTQ